MTKLCSPETTGYALVIVGLSLLTMVTDTLFASGLALLVGGLQLMALRYCVLRKRT